MSENNSDDDNKSPDPEARPLITIDSIIDSASRAFANNREGVLHRALLEQAGRRENRPPEDGEK